MNPLTRPPTRVLFLHDGESVEVYISYLQRAGLDANEARADNAVAEAVAFKPDVIVLDFDCDGETMTELRNDGRTRAIPVIALADVPTRGRPK
jgi:DNA-binding response OmpR family regulator